MTTDSPPAIPLIRTCPFAPPDEHVRIRDDEPVSRVTLPSGQAAWVLTRHQDVRAMLGDPRFSSDRRNPGFPRLAAELPPDNGRFRGSLISMDPPEHLQARRAVVGEFTVRRLEALRPRIQQIVDEFIDAMLAGPRPTDLVRALSLPVPSLVICELLGVPYADHEFFQQNSSTLIRHTAPPADRRRAADALGDYLDALVAEKEKNPGDDLIGRQIERGDSDHDGLVGLAFLLLLAGHETTANMISLGTMMFLRDPDAADAIRRDPAKTALAVEELLRYFTIAELALGRVAREDVALGGVLIRAGEGVLALANTANRDPASFDDADEFDVDRGARHHLAFGFGPHQCLGQNLARVELQVVFDTLLHRVPTLHAAVPLDSLPYKEDATVYGIWEFPVSW